MSTGLTITPNQSNPEISQKLIVKTPKVETNPPIMESATKDDQVVSCSDINDSCPPSLTPNKIAEEDNQNHSNQEKSNHEQPAEDNTSEQKNDSSTFSTAFTISFDDDSTATKKLGIRDSIRKFAPPKPHTIEKPRQPKNDQSHQDNSLTSIESAPAEIQTKHTYRKVCSNSSRSSSRKSTSSRHSNVSESAAFLIDRMLNFKQSNGDEQSNPQEALDSSTNKPKKPTKTTPTKANKSNRMVGPVTDILDSEIDFCEDKSDNGTYIVGADPESDAARKKIDELFGVVKAAGASVIAERVARNQKVFDSRTSTRPSRALDKKPPSIGERSEPVNQVPRRNNSFVSRSSSSSRHDNIVSEKPRTSSHHSRNSSCDRTSKVHQSKPRRSISQSSRQSSNKEASDGDTRSSRSSLRNDFEVANQETSLPSMKFNRAFALRRARLGLGEPVRMVASVSSSHEVESVNNLSSSSRRHQANANTYRQNQPQTSSTGSTSFCRDDGGRFSLRMKNSILPNRLTSAPHATGRPPQHQTLLDSYISKVALGKYGGLPSVNIMSEKETQKNSSSKYINQSHTTTSSLPYQSGDEQESISPARYKHLLNKSNHVLRNQNMVSEQESDTESYNRFNYSLGTEFEQTNQLNFIDSRACSSTGKRGSTLQLGALDSLVISAISSLSLKIRQSVCDVLVEQAKKLPVENETRSIVEEIFPQLTANSSDSKSPTSIEEIDQSLYFDLARTLKNLKKVEQMVDVINLISNQLPASPTTTYNYSQSGNSNFRQHTVQTTGTVRTSDSTTNSEANNTNDLSPV